MEDKYVVVIDGMTIDLSMFRERGAKIVVRCVTEQQTDDFLAAMVKVYPERSKNLLRIESMWEWARDPDSHIDFYPCDEAYMSWDNEWYAENHGYSIVYFRDIATAIDFGDLNPCESSLDSLFLVHKTIV